MDIKKQSIAVFYKFLIIAFILSAKVALAQNGEGLIYGKITTIDGQSYLGQIRWGGEEVFWNDHFNSTKLSNDNVKYLSLKEQNQKDKDEDGWGFDWKFLNIWEDKYSGSSHQFVCRFGDIRVIQILDRDDVKLTFKNNTTTRLRGGANDIGATVSIFDKEIGQLKIKWSRIEKVEFMSTPKNLKNKFGNPVYGTVSTYRKGKFQGFIQWDHDERIDTDILDGDSKDGDLSIQFKNIKSIEKSGRGSLVILNSGRELYLTGSNDVNSGNRGIIVTTEGLGKIDIPWKLFQKVDLQKPTNDGKKYSDYANPGRLRGKVKVIDGQSVSGRIIYDLDEAWDFEILDGQDDEVEYTIPFRNIKKIIPKNYNYSIIILRNGKELLLGDGQDVSEDNDGILVFKRNEEKPVYIKWKRIEEIEFE